MKLAITIALLAAFSVPAAAQQQSWDYAGGGFGASDFHVRDDHATPLIFSAWGTAPEVQFIHVGEGNRQYAEASFYSAILSSAPPNFRTDNWRGRIRYAYAVQAWESAAAERPLRVFIGGSVTSFLNRSNYYYFIPPLNGYGTSIDSWYWSSSLDVALLAECVLAEREFISLQLFVPILSNISRPQYSPSGDYSYTENTFKMKMFGRTEFFPKNLSCDVVLSFQMPVFWRFNAGVNYEFYFTSYDVPRETKLFMNNARGAIYFCF